MKGLLRQGFQDRGALTGGRLSARGYRGKVWEGGERWETGLN